MSIFMDIKNHIILYAESEVLQKNKKINNAEMIVNVFDGLKKFKSKILRLKTLFLNGRLVYGTKERARCVERV
mgnify:CR=1 FL=1